MENEKSFGYFGSLRKSPTRKKTKVDSQSNISFWDNMTATYEEEKPNIGSDEFDLSFTSTEIVSSQNIKAESLAVKFIVRNIEKEIDKTILFGDDVICTVLGEWMEIEYEPNTKITVIPCLCCPNNLNRNIVNRKLNITVDDTQNYLFVEDDLMTITNVVSSIRCFNKPFINRKVANLDFNFQDKCLINGIILHSVMEDVIINRNYNIQYIVETAKKAIANNAMNIYVCDTSEKNVYSDILQSLNNISFFGKNKLHFDETEKRVASLVCNLKGNIDAVGPNTILEIKSGKSMDISHKAQVMLYSLLMKEKYKRNFDSYLFYTASNNLVKVDIKHAEIKSLFILRNKLAIKNEIIDCDCSPFEPCKIINKIKCLPDDHYLKTMLKAIEKEEYYRLKETWNRVVFKKQVDITVIFKFDFEPSVIDDIYINIYNEDLIKLCKGIISSINENIMTVSLSEKINLENNKFYFISFGCSDLFFKFLIYSLINIAYFRFLDQQSLNGFRLPGEEFGLKIDDDLDSFSSEDIDKDKIEMISPESTNDSNENEDMDDVTVNKICCNEKDLKLEHSIDSSSSFVYFTPPSPALKRYKYKIPEIYQTQFLALNDEQKSSLFLSLNCEHYKIVHGMPGTGKSSIIILLIKILVSLNLKVLLVCYTNLAITNILDKLKTIRSYRARKENIEFKSSDDIKKYYKNVDLVASTCFGFSDPIFIDRKFDFCIIDEGSQQHLLLTLIPVHLSNKFVIFGDHLQLKPLVKAGKALSTSLFEYLLDEDHSELHTQYRMGNNIMRLSNILFYNNKLVAGTNIEDSVKFIDSTTINYSEFIQNVRNTTILCYFNSQVKLTKLYTDCQVETIDRFQGSEDENIIVVFDPVTACEVMESPERLNVALTRAKKSLILIGDKQKMNEITILRNLIEIL